MLAFRPRRPARLLGTVALVLSLTILNFALACPPPAGFAAPDNQDQQQASGHYRGRVLQDLKHAVARVQPLLLRYGYPALFLAIMVEGVGLLAPGQTLLMAAAFAAAQGRLSIVWVLLCAFTAAAVGNSLGYLIGRRGGRPLLRRLKVNEQHLAKMEAHFSRGGKWVVLVARFVDGLRQLNGIVAGLLKMPWPVFTTFNILGAALWTGVWGLGVFFFDKEVVSLHLTLHEIKPWAAAFFLLAVLALVVHLLRPSRKKEMGGGPGT
jgi:membrane protein DedA with SNARE-associated domain